MTIRSDQGALGRREGVQPRPTSRKRLDGWKARRYLVCPTVQPRPTCSAHPRAYRRVHARARARLCAYIQVRQVRRLGSQVIAKAFFRPTLPEQVGRIAGGWA